MADASGARIEPYRVRLQLRWGDVDQLGHVNNVRYLEYAQEARLRYLHERLGGEGQPGLGAIVVRRIDVSFDRSLLYSTEGIDVVVRPIHLGTTSFTLRHEIYDPAGTLYASMDAVIVAVDLEAGRSRPLPDPVREAIAAGLNAA